MMVREMAGMRKMMVVMVTEMIMLGMGSHVLGYSAQQPHIMVEGTEAVKKVVREDMTQTLDSTKEDLVLVMWWW